MVILGEQNIRVSETRHCGDTRGQNSRVSETRNCGDSWGTEYQGK